jgi:hypothetical protein
MLISELNPRYPPRNSGRDTVKPQFYTSGGTTYNKCKIREITIQHKEKCALLSLAFLKQNDVNIKSAKISITGTHKMKYKYE